MNVIFQEGIRDIPTSFHRSLPEAFNVLRRRRWLIAGTVALVMSLVGVYLCLAPPRYTATAELVFDSRVAPASEIPGLETPDDAFVISEMDVIRSRSLAERVLYQLDLEHDSRFNPKLAPQSRLKAWVIRSLPSVWGRLHAAEQETSITARDRLIDIFRKSVDVLLTPRSRTVAVKFTADEPSLAASVVNALVHSYLLSKMEGRLENAKRVSTWLSEQIQRARVQAERSAQAVENYRKEHNLFETGNETLISQRIAELNNALTDASIKRRAMEADLLQVRRLLSGGGTIEATSQVLASDLIRKYREEEMALERREAEATEQYGDQHPTMLALQAEKRRIKDKVRLEIAKVAASLESEAQTARDRENGLSSTLHATKATLAEANDALIGLRTLQRQADADKLVLDRLQTGIVRSNVEEDAKAQVPDARIISMAAVPQTPSSPQVWSALFAGLIVACFGGVLVAFLVEYSDGGFRGVEQVEAACNLPVLAQVPRVRANPGHVAAYGLHYRRSAYAAAIGAIYTRLALMRGKVPPKVIVLTSGEPGVGKSTLALSLARWETMHGRRVILIEADTYRPSVAGMAGVAQTPGLTDVLSGIVGLRDAIQRDTHLSLDLMTSGAPISAQTGHTGINGIGGILDLLRDDYDLIVVDAPPVLGVSDANVASAAADATILVVEWGRTLRQVFLAGVNEVFKFGGRVDGVILSKVDVRKQAYYNYGDAQAYGGRAAKAYIG